MSTPHQRAQQLIDAGQLDAAVRVLESHLRTVPRDAEAMILLAQMVNRQGNREGTVHWLKKAVNAAPHDDGVQLLVGNIYAQLRLADEAIRRFEKVLALRPNSADAHLSLGLVYLDLLKEPAKAAESFRSVLEAAPESMEASFNLGKALFDLGQVDAAIAQFRRACELAERAGKEPSRLKCLETIAIAIPGAMAADNAAILAARKAWAAAIEPPDPQHPPFGARDRTPERPLNIGYISSFFAGENWMKPVWGLINRHDRNQYRVRLFSFGPVPGCEEGATSTTAYRPHESDRVFDVEHVDNDRVAKLIADEEIDVLVDLNGYSDPQRLGVLFSRPAPIVIGWFNMYATTGMRSFDYLIGDRHVVRAGEEQDYSERVLRVPGSYLTFEVAYPVPEVATAPCLQNGFITFGSLCSRYKILPEVIQAWSEILVRCPTARLVLRNGGLKQSSERDHLLRQFMQCGIDADRVELLGSANHFEFLETYSRIDIALDTFPYNGGTTTTEAIWQGVPVVAYAGPTWASRTSATLLQEGQLADWVANDLSGYVELAVSVANDPTAPQRLAELRTTMRARLKGSPVCDTPGFARHMEQLYREAWREWCQS